MPLPTLAVGAEHPPGYRVVQSLCEDSATPVYAVEHLGLGTRCALQLFPALPEGAREGEPELFVAKARLGRLVDSEHVAATLDAGVTDGIPWILLERLEGEDLGQRVETRGGLERVAAGRALWALGDVLGKAHAVGVVHGGLRPELVFVGRTSEQIGELFSVKVLGFGVAGYSVDAEPIISSRSGDTTRLQRWLSPEQIGGGPAQVGPATDVWTLGLLAFWMLTGKSFWKAERPADLAVEVMLTPLPSASERARELGVADRIQPSFDAWFARCVAREPEARFRDAGEAAAVFFPRPPVQPLLLANPKGVLYDQGLRRAADDAEREATDADGRVGYRRTTREPPLTEDHLLIRANPKGSLYDGGLRDPRRWPAPIVVALLLVGAFLYGFFRR